MSEYDYLNARVRGMSTDLLTSGFYEQVLAAYSETILMDALLGSAYSEDLRRARERHASLSVAAAVEAAVWSHAAATFQRLLFAAPPSPRRLIALQLNRWDVAAVAALARARLAGAPPHEALASVLPLGEMTAEDLARLAAEPDLDGLADALTAGKRPIGFEMRRALRECPAPADPRAVERSLYQAYFAWALGQLREGDPHEVLLRDGIRRHIDIMNVVTLLTGIRARPQETRPDVLYERGLLPQKFLDELAACPALEDAFEALASSYLGPGVEKGILTYGQSQSLGVMERFLEAVVVEHSCRLFRRDSLSASVPLGFIWRAYNECVNLRLLARGTRYHMPAAAVRLELVMV